MVYLAEKCSDILALWHLLGDQPSETLPVSPLVSLPLYVQRAAGFNQPDFCSHLFHILLLLSLDSSSLPPPSSSHLFPSCIRLLTSPPPKPELSFLPGGWSGPSDSSHSTALGPDQYSGARTLSLCNSLSNHPHGYFCTRTTTTQSNQFT